MCVCVCCVANLFVLLLNLSIDMDVTRWTWSIQLECVCFWRSNALSVRDNDNSIGEQWSSIGGWLAGWLTTLRRIYKYRCTFCVFLRILNLYMCIAYGNQVFSSSLAVASANPFHLCAISLFQFPFYSINVVCMLSFWSFCGIGFVFYFQCS